MDAIWLRIATAQLFPRSISTVRDVDNAINHDGRRDHDQMMKARWYERAGDTS